MKLEYLRHIDGLRALAVLSVIFFHFGVGGFSGGYIGVDIFFVISGFLITRIIQNEIKTTGSFQFIAFYRRRIRRLLPALIFTFFVTTLVAVLLFTPENLSAYGPSLVAAVLSISNIFFWFESGYFDTASHLKPLLHTWSLSVEEQFYILWPALMWWALKKADGFGLRFVLTMGALSLLLSAYVVHKAAPGFESTIFYLTPFRVFEFAIGAAGVFIIGRFAVDARWHELMAAVGFSLIVFSLCTLDTKSVFPFINALPSCCGALLLILADQSRLAKFLLGNRLMVGIGLMSYSLYLIHWPLYVFTKYVFYTVSSPEFIALMLLATFAIASFSYYCVETPWREGARAERWFFKAVALILVILSALGVLMKRQFGWEWRFHIKELSEGKEFFGVKEIEAGKQKRFKGINRACSILDLDNADRCHLDRPIQMLFFGNSHELDAVNMFQALYENNPEVNFIFFGTVNDCVIDIKGANFSSESTVHQCHERFERLRNPNFLKSITHLVYNAHFGFDSASKEMWSVLANILHANSKIKLIALGSYISTSVDCATLINKSGSFDACKTKDVVDYFYSKERNISQVPEVKTLPYLYISKYELLCTNNELATCETHADGEPMFYDQHHLSYGFSRHLGQLIGKAYKKELHDLGLPEVQ